MVNQSRVPKDFLGNEIQIGNTIAYCVAWGRAQVQQLYTVLDIQDGVLICECVLSLKGFGGPTRKSRLPDPEKRAIKLWMSFEEGKQ